MLKIAVMEMLILIGLLFTIIGALLTWRDEQRQPDEDVAPFDADYQMLYDEIMEELHKVLKGERR